MNKLVRPFWVAHFEQIGGSLSRRFFRMDVNYYLSEFKTKCESKGLQAADFAKKLTERLPQYKGRWQSSMSEQIPDLPGFDQVERELQRHLKKLKL